MSDTILEIKKLNFSYGSLCVLKDFNMKVPKSSVTAFVGRNGAGKTTTFSIVSGFLPFSKGKVYVNGLELNRYRQQGGMIGVLPQDVSFFPDRSVYSQMLLFAKLSGVPAAERKDKVEFLLQEVGLKEKIKVSPYSLSRGMKMRLGIAQAFLGDPPLVMLDEPTAGLDPMVKNQFYELLQRFKSKTTFIISSHQLEELEVICDFICMIEKGQNIAEQSMSTLLKTQGVRYFVKGIKATQVVEFNNRHEGFKAILNENGDILEVESQKEHQDMAQINQVVLPWLLESGVLLYEIKQSESLSQKYIQRLKS